MDDLTRSNADPGQDVMVEHSSIDDSMINLNLSAVELGE